MNNPVQMTDEKLIQFYLNGNPKAMATLVELYKDRIYGVIYSMVHDRYASEEIFQEVFIRVINNLMAGKNTDGVEFLPWAISIAKSLCLEYSRKPGQGFVLHSNSDVKFSSAGSLSEPAVLTGTFYHESHGRIKSLIDMLPEEQREVIALKHYGGLSFNEITGIMKCSLTNALDIMRSGLNNLCKLMAEKEMVVD